MLIVVNLLLPFVMLVSHIVQPQTKKNILSGQSFHGTKLPNSEQLRNMSLF